MSSDQANSGSPVAIRVDRVSKCYRIYDHPRDRLKQALFGRFGHSYARDFWALRDISFEVRAGEMVGIIGRNGSGKSTLLQIVAGALTPTAGGVDAAGRISAMLELGAGFNPEFTGRENVYLTGAIMGMNRAQVDEVFDDIASFANIGEFIDQPVRVYSSGMYVRLAFAVQTCVEPDVLLVDEALSVGDIFFTQKCFRRMQELVQNGTALLFVSHDLGTVAKLCSRVIYLEDGLVRGAGDPADVLALYTARRRAGGDAVRDPREPQPTEPKPSGPHSNQSDSDAPTGSDPAADDTMTSDTSGAMVPVDRVRANREAVSVEIVGFAFSAGRRGADETMIAGDRVALVVWLAALGDGVAPFASFQIKDRFGAIATGSDSHQSGCGPLRIAKGDRLQFNFHIDLMLGSGEYTLTLGASSLDDAGETVFDWIEQVHSFVVVRHRGQSADGHAFCPLSATVEALPAAAAKMP